MPAPRRALPLLSALVLAAGLVACGDDEEGSAERDPNDDVAFNSCDEVECEGEIEGAAYEIALPEQWNGTLLLYSHGYRNAEAAPPNFDEPSTQPDPAPGWSAGNTEVGEALLEDGYALAGSAYASNGWAVEDGVTAGEDLYEFFRTEVGEPNRVYVWGDSLGGLITTLLAEKHPDWVSGVAPFCGAVAGPNDNLDIALDVAYAVKTFFYPELKLEGFTSNDEANQQWQAAAQALMASAADVSVGVPRILLTAALVDAPSKTRTYDGSSVESTVRGYAEAVLTALGFSTFGRYDIEQRVGGNPSGNADQDYAERVSEEERALIETVSPGATDTLLKLLEDGERVEADQSAREAFATTGTPTGALQDRAIALHTSADPLVIVQNQTVYRDRYVANEDASADFIQLFTVPPASYSPDEGAPYGAGHCNFTPESRLAVIDLLDNWVKNGVYPGSAAIAEAMGTDSGFSAAYMPGDWPNPDVR
jgi:pimeloyl-ACP methyl ester carboxylesterase